MNEDSPIGGLIVFVIFLLVHGILYGFGAAVQNLNESNVEKKAEEGDKRSEKLLHIIKEPARFVNTLLATITLVNMVVGAYVYVMLHRWFLRLLVSESVNVWQMQLLRVFAWIVPAFLLLAVLMIFGILVPKKLAQWQAERWAYALLGITGFLSALLFPLIWVITGLSNAVLRLFGIDPYTSPDNVTEEEIMSMVNEGHEQGVLLASEAEMITNIFEFGDKEAKDIMTHRNSIVAIDGDMPLKEAIHFMLSQSNSRYPVYEENIDHIIGVLHLKDAMRIHNKDVRINLPVRKISGLLREAKVIPETRNIDSIFKMMQSTKTQMVIVIDEYGQTAGLVAMEDILEEIVGNIWDEYDEDEKHIEIKGEDEYVIEGKTPLKELEDKFHISFEEEEFETLNGFLISKMDKIPEEDEQFSVEVGGYEFKLLSVENKMIQSVLVTKLPEEHENGESLEEGGKVDESEN